jgi:hypothetical protein
MNQSDKDYDAGIIQVLLQRFENQRLPRLIDMKENLDRGDRLNEFDIEFLSEALHDIQSLLPHMDKHPEYQDLMAKVMHYYKVITDEAFSNEK